MTLLGLLKWHSKPKLEFQREGLFSIQGKRPKRYRARETVLVDPRTPVTLREYANEECALASWEAMQIASRTSGKHEENNDVALEDSDLSALASRWSGLSPEIREAVLRVAGIRRSLSRDP
jgi:hypothetical protein